MKHLQIQHFQRGIGEQALGLAQLEPGGAALQIERSARLRQQTRQLGARLRAGSAGWLLSAGGSMAHGGEGPG